MIQIVIKDLTSTQVQVLHEFLLSVEQEIWEQVDNFEDLAPVFESVVGRPAKSICQWDP